MLKEWRDMEWIRRRVIYMPEPWEYWCACEGIFILFKTKQEYDAHFEEVEWAEMAERFRVGNMYGERGENVDEVQELTRQSILAEF